MNMNFIKYFMKDTNNFEFVSIFNCIYFNSYIIQYKLGFVEEISMPTMRNYLLHFFSAVITISLKIYKS